MRTWSRASLLFAAAALTGCGLGVPLDDYSSGTSAGGDASLGGGGGASGTAVDASADATGDAKGGAGGSTPDAAVEATTWPGASCSAPGTYACAGSAQQVVVACENGAWEHFLDCTGAELCDSTLAPTVSDRCAEQVPICAGQAPGAYVCDGAKLTHCGPDLVSSTTDDCGSAQLCALHVGAACAVCADGEFQCSGAELKACAADHLSFTTKTTCASASLCNAGAGQCTSATCVSGQYRCTGADLEVCNATQTGFDEVKTCASAGLCDAPNGACDVCVAGTTSCADATHPQTCASDGSGWTTVACPAAAPICVGAGQCVGCTSTADCPPPANPCEKATCSASVCGTQVTSGATCNDGDACTKGDTCSASGVCAGTAYTCDAPPDACHTSPATCQGDGTCAYPAKADGTACSGPIACRNYACNAGVCTDKGSKVNGASCGLCMACNAGACVSKCTAGQACKCGGMCVPPGYACP